MKIKTINIIIIITIIFGLIFISAVSASAEDKAGTRTEIVYEKQGQAYGTYFEGDVIYLLRNTPCTIRAFKAETVVEVMDVPPEYRYPGFEDSYKRIEEEFPINGTVKLKVFKNNALVQEIEEINPAGEKEKIVGVAYYNDAEKRFMVNLGEGEYIFKLEVDGSVLKNSERNVEVIREKSQDVIYRFNYQPSESSADTVYMTKSNDVSVGFEIRKEVDKEYFDKIGANMIINDRGWVDSESEGEMILELSGGGEVKKYEVKQEDGSWGLFDKVYVINIKSKGNYNIRLLNKDTGEVLEGSERRIRVIDVEKSFIPFLFAAIPILAGIIIIILRKQGYKIIKL